MILSPETLRKILALYGLSPRLLGDAQKGYRNTSHHITLENGDEINLILYKSEPQILDVIKKIHAVSTELPDLSFDLRRLYHSKIMRVNHYYTALYNYLPGTTIPWGSFSRQRMKNVGSMMAELHLGLRQVAVPAPSIHRTLLEQIMYMEKYFADQAATQALKSKLKLVVDIDWSVFRSLCQYAGELPQQQLVHMDVVRGNILFSGQTQARPSGLIDFEKVAYGRVEFDLARTLAFLWTDNIERFSPRDMSRYLLYSGYCKLGGGLVDFNFVYALVRYFLLHDFYKFLLHNPYEFLYRNQHYLAVRRLLLERGLVKRYTLAKEEEHDPELEKAADPAK